MNHDEAARLLGPYLDGELDLTTCLKLEEHLAECPTCRDKMTGEQELTASIRENVPLHKASPFLKTRILAAVREQQTSPAMLPWWKRLSLPWTLSGATVIAAFVGLLTLSAISEEGTPTWARDAISDHVRSLQVNHLMDVVSTDQHTVKPWFAGKIDYSPQVIDLTPSGYPLIGGRLDVLDGHNVAAIIYQRRKHYINLFVWPAASQPLRDATYQRDGYHVLSWTKSNMNYVAVSELGEKELQDFVQMIQEQTVDSRPGE
jgi:anti-sigma factor RsiW